VYHLHYFIIVLLPALLMILPFSSTTVHADNIALPSPSHKGKISVEEALKNRRTHRSFSSKALSLDQLSQVLWAAYGVTAKKHGYALKTAPSAGALYPMDIYALVGKQGVEKLPEGVYHYKPENHTLEVVQKKDQRHATARASLGQTWMAEAPIMLVITGEYARCTVKYGRRGVSYTYIEAGCVGQNIFLQAEALGLKAGIVGAFNNKRVIEVLGIPAAHDPILIMPVGYPD